MLRVKVERQVRNHKVVAHGGIYSSGLEFDSRLLDFSSNVNPLGYPPTVKKVFKKNLSLLSIYPDPDSNELRDCLEKYLKISKNQIVVGNGATELIYNYCKAFLRGKRTLIPIPTFQEYESAARLNGAKISFFKTLDLNQDISKLQEMIVKDSCIFLCNPNNPTGVLVTRKKMQRILEFAYDKSAMVFLDECFIELVPTGNESVISHLKEFDNLFILRSLTKSFGLAGIRIGYGLANKKIIEIMQKIKIPWNVSGIAQKVSVEALNDRSYLEKTRRMIMRESKFLRNSISAMNNLTCYDSNANFILIRSTIKSGQMKSKLLKRNILVRDCKNVRGLDSNHIRVAIRTHKENLKLVKALKKL